MIAPHGGQLVNCLATETQKRDLLAELPEMKKVVLDPLSLTELDNIAVGLYSPLNGFMTKAEYKTVVEKMRLPSGVVWPLPIVLGVSREEAQGLAEGSLVALIGVDQRIYGVLHLTELYTVDLKQEAEAVFGSASLDHPGVVELYQRGQVLLGGKILLLERPSIKDFAACRLDPADTRRRFEELGWRTVVGFQTRNPIHRAHEYIQKCAMEMVDGLFLNPLVGWTKADDVDAKTRMETYQVLLDKYYPRQRVLMAVFPAAMRYAGPREAVFHALCRKNYGCTHMIIGRDHAGVGDFYGTYDAQRIFEGFTREEMGITPLCFEHTFYCYACGNMASSKTCPHPTSERLHLSGTRVRELLRQGEAPPPELTRPEVAMVLIRALSAVGLRC